MGVQPFFILLVIFFFLFSAGPYLQEQYIFIHEKRHKNTG